MCKKKREDKRDGSKVEEAACQIRCSNEHVALCTVQMGDDARCQCVFITLCVKCVMHGKKNNTRRTPPHMGALTRV